MVSSFLMLVSSHECVACLPLFCVSRDLRRSDRLAELVNAVVQCQLCDGIKSALLTVKSLVDADADAIKDIAKLTGLRTATKSPDRLVRYFVGLPLVWSSSMLSTH